MDKKPYTPPTVTNLGPIVEATRGFGGETWELGNRRMYIAVKQ